MSGDKTKIKRLNILIKAYKVQVKHGYQIFICNLHEDKDFRRCYSDSWYPTNSLFLIDLKILEAAKKCDLVDSFISREAFKFNDINSLSEGNYKRYNARKLQILELALTLV